MFNINNFNSPVSVALQLVPGLNLGLSIVSHPFDVLVGDGFFLFVAGTVVLRAHMEDAVGVDLEGDLDLVHATGRGGDVCVVEYENNNYILVFLGHGSLALEHLDGDGVLVVVGSEEDLKLLFGDDGITEDQVGHHAGDGLNTEVAGVGVGNILFVLLKM